MQHRRRALVLVNEAARHPFRRALPPHVTRGYQAEPARPWWSIEARDWRDFFTAYCASVAAVAVFIS